MRPDQCIRDATARLPKSACGFVKKSQLTAPAARRATEITTIASTATARSAAKVARASIARFRSRRRRSRVTSGRLEGIETAHDYLGNEVGDQAEHERIAAR